MNFQATSRVLDLQKYILSGAIEFISLRSSLGNLSLFEITRTSELFSRKMQMQFIVLRKRDFFPIRLSIPFSNPKILGFLFLREIASSGSEMRKIKRQKIVGISFKSCTRMKRSSRNSQPSSSNRKFQAIFASHNRYFTENSRPGRDSFSEKES